QSRCGYLFRMGRCTYSAIGYGMTVTDARRDAIERARQEHGDDPYSGTIAASVSEEKVECLVRPVPPKRCKVEREPRKGALKWETRYVADTLGYERGQRVASEKTMGACIKKAREW